MRLPANIQPSTCNVCGMLLFILQHSTAQHSTAQHSTAQHSTAQHSTGICTHSALAPSRRREEGERRIEGHHCFDGNHNQSINQSINQTNKQTNKQQSIYRHSQTFALLSTPPETTKGPVGCMSTQFTKWSCADSVLKHLFVFKSHTRIDLSSAADNK